jgi:hypothetical protein
MAVQYADVNYLPTQKRFFKAKRAMFLHPKYPATMQIGGYLPAMRL